MPKFAYSYDREDFTGNYNSPEEAFADAAARAAELPNPPTSIYIGTIVEADPQATDHAERIIESMNRRAHVDIGDSAAKYLLNVRPEQRQELDHMIAATILSWLGKNSLMPTFVRVRSIQEHPIENPKAVPADRTSTEVGELGPWREVGMDRP